MTEYPKYKPSGVHWIDTIPVDWSVSPLKHVAAVQPSNVDKKSVEGEQKVLLCNYVDVYKNDFITDDIDFMEATASESQIEKFQLSIGDVLITKDSETPQDIAVPALVKTEMENLICGYHLAQIKPDPSVLIGGYLFRLFQSKQFNTNFEIAANGITRYGLGSESVSNVKIVLPPLTVQAVISDYLDKKTALIDTAISKKQKLIVMLQEEKAAVINQAVTKGVNPAVKLKHSGFDWMGDVPSHWELKKLKYVLDFYNNKRVPLSSDQRGHLEKIYDYYGASGVIDKVDNYLFDGEYILIGEDGANLLTRSTALAFKAIGKFWVNNHAHILKPKSGDIDYFVFLLESMDYAIYVSGSAQPKLTIENLADIVIPVPPIAEQLTIVSFINHEENNIEFAVSQMKKEIELLYEYKAALINEVVTGKVKII